MLTCYCMAGGLDHLALQLPFKLSLVGSSQEGPAQLFHLTPKLLLIMSQLPPVTTYSKSSGKLRRPQIPVRICLQKSTPLCNTSTKPILALQLEDSLSLYLRNPNPSHLVNQGLKQ